MSDTHHYLSGFSDWLASWGASENTIRARVTVLDAALRAWDCPPAAVTTRDLEVWLASPTFSAWTRVTYYGHARSFFGWLADADHIDVDPTLRLRRPRPPRDVPRPLTADELSRVLAVADGNVRSFILLALYAGLRAHEIAKVSGEDVGPEAIHVVGKGGQSALLPTHPELWTLALSHPRYGWWFPSSQSSLGHVRATSVSTMTTRLFSSLGIPGSIHRVRHSFGTNLLRSGANVRVVQSLLRHSSLATTALYTAVDDDERMAAIRGLAA